MAELPHVSRVGPGNLSKEVSPQLTPSPIPRSVTRVKWGSRYICREFPFTTGCAESIQACAERNSLSTKPWILVVWCRRLAVSRGSLAMPQGGLAPPSLERDVALGGWPALAEE
jgi:hypothetical protein